VTSQNVTVQWDVSFAMVSLARSEQITDEAQAGGSKSTAGALVPLAEPAQWSARRTRRFPPDPTFVTQLIADAERLAQGQSLRCESAADALAAYHARQYRRCRAGLLTRQTV
jgi:hypothetical protein